jgi:hypothetical protein
MNEYSKRHTATPYLLNTLGVVLFCQCFCRRPTVSSHRALNGAECIINVQWQGVWIEMTELQGFSATIRMQCLVYQVEKKVEFREVHQTYMSPEIETQWWARKRRTAVILLSWLMYTGSPRWNLMNVLPYLERYISRALDRTVSLASSKYSTHSIRSGEQLPCFSAAHRTETWFSKRNYQGIYTMNTRQLTTKHNKTVLREWIFVPKAESTYAMQKVRFPLYWFLKILYEMTRYNWVRMMSNDQAATFEKQWNPQL